MWAGNSENSHRAKIKWPAVCLPKEEGGLGLHRIKDLNDANVKRIDEMDYSSSSWSKSKRKKMRRRNRISKSVMYSNVVDTNTLSND